MHISLSVMIVFFVYLVKFRLCNYVHILISERMISPLSGFEKHLYPTSETRILQHIL